jgi:hypothetical protein
MFLGTALRAWLCLALIPATDGLVPAIEHYCSPKVAKRPVKHRGMSEERSGAQRRSEECPGA